MGLFSKDIKNMDDLFVHTLRDIYYAEKQIVKSLPEMIEKANNPQLKQGFRRTCAKAKTMSNGWSRSFSCSASRRRASTVRRSTASSKRPRTSLAKCRTKRCSTPR